MTPTLIGQRIRSNEYETFFLVPLLNHILQIEVYKFCLTKIFPPLTFLEVQNGQETMARLIEFSYHR